MSYPQSSPFPSENTTSSGSLTDEGTHLRQASDADAALNVLSQAIELHPSDGAAFQYLGIARARTGPLAAMALCLRALAEAGRFAEHTVSASTLDDAGNHALEQSHDSSARATVACARLSQLLTLGNAAAREEAAKAARLRPDNRQGQYRVARTQGREALETFAKTAPDNYWTKQAQFDLTSGAVSSLSHV